MQGKWFPVLFATMILLFSLSLAVCATPTPEVTSISPAQGLDNQVVTVTVQGTKFYTKATTVKLTKEGQPDIVGTNVTFSKTELTCTLDLTGKAIGDWDVVVTNNGKVLSTHKTGTLTPGFKILSSAPTITSISPVSALNTESPTLKVIGSNFRAGALVNLLKSDNTVLVSNKASEISPNGDQLNVELNLVSLAPDTYSVQVINTDGSQVVDANVFTITEAPGAEATSVDTDAQAEADAQAKAQAEADAQAKAQAEADAQTKAQAEADAKAKAQAEADAKAQADAQAKTQAQNTQAGPVDPNTLFKSIYFDFDKFAVRPDQIDALKADLEVVRKNQGYIVLGGHADERGPSSYNLKLSAKRADTIKRYLIMSGIDPSKIITYAYGETSPLKLGHDEESWKYNRRVDIAIWATAPNQKDALKK